MYFIRHSQYIVLEPSLLFILLHDSLLSFIMLFTFEQFIVYYVCIYNAIHAVTLVVSLQYTVYRMSILVCYLILRCVLCYAHAILPGPNFCYYLGLLEVSNCIRSHFLSRRNVLSGGSLLLLCLANTLPHNIFIC
jgi:hypothetical protein